MPADSSWNTPVVSPRWNNLYVSLSSSGNSDRLISVPCTLRMIRMALLIIDKFDSPKKSILSNPNSSTSPIGNWVATTPFCACSSGRYLTRSSGAITTPHACTPCERIVPSSFIAKSSTRCATGLLSYSFLRSGSSTTDILSGI